MNALSDRCWNEQFWMYQPNLATPYTNESSNRRFFCHSEDFPIVVLQFQLIVVSMHFYLVVECSLWKTFEALRCLYYSGLYPLACSSGYSLDIYVVCMSASRTIFHFVWLDRTMIPGGMKKLCYLSIAHFFQFTTDENCSHIHRYCLGWLSKMGKLTPSPMKYQLAHHRMVWTHSSLPGTIRPISILCALSSMRGNHCDHVPQK